MGSASDRRENGAAGSGEHRDAEDNGPKKRGPHPRNKRLWRRGGWRAAFPGGSGTVTRCYGVMLPRRAASKPSWWLPTVSPTGTSSL